MWVIKLRTEGTGEAGEPCADCSRAWSPGYQPGGGLLSGRWAAATHSPTPKKESQQVEHIRGVGHLLCPRQTSTRLFYVKHCELGASSWGF